MKDLSSLVLGAVNYTSVYTVCALRQLKFFFFEGVRQLKLWVKNTISPTSKL